MRKHFIHDRKESYQHDSVEYEVCHGIEFGSEIALGAAFPCRPAVEYICQSRQCIHDIVDRRERHEEKQSYRTAYAQSCYDICNISVYFHFA